MGHEDSMKCAEELKVSLKELIKIINPNDSGQVSIAGDSKSSASGNNAEELEFTDAELQFMSDEIEANELAALLKDDELRMPVEIEEAYEEFLNEQQAVLPVVPLNES